VTWILCVLVLGHVYLAVINPATRHALRGMTLGDVDRDWALHHHRKWVEAEEAAAQAAETPAPSTAPHTA
jgi:cytochrome b subunit of formate dehydrogenase